MRPSAESERVEGRAMLREFKEFIAKGNAIDLAIGVVIGAAFGTIVTSLVNGIIMPLVGLLLGRVDFSNLFIILRQGATSGPYDTLKAATDSGAVVLSYGVLVNAIVGFFIIAFVIFLMVKGINRIRRPEAPLAMKDCPYCKMPIPKAATRCPDCTSELTASSPAAS